MKDCSITTMGPPHGFLPSGERGCALAEFPCYLHFRGSCSSISCNVCSWMLQKQWEQDISASSNVLAMGVRAATRLNSQLLQKSEKSVEKNFGESVNEARKVSKTFSPLEPPFSPFNLMYLMPHAHAMCHIIYMLAAWACDCHPTIGSKSLISTQTQPLWPLLKGKTQLVEMLIQQLLE